MRLSHCWLLQANTGENPLLPGIYTLNRQRKGVRFVPILQMETWKREMLRHLSTFTLPAMEPRSPEFESNALTTKPSSLQFQCLINDDDVCSFLLSSHPFINDDIVVIPLLCVWLSSSYITSSRNHVHKHRICWSFPSPFLNVKPNFAFSAHLFYVIE